MVEQTSNPDGSVANVDEPKADGLLASSRRTLMRAIPALGVLSTDVGVQRGQAATDESTVDTTDQQNATFSGSHGTYTIDAAGNLNKSSDGYGAIYRDDGIATESTVVTTVESQENTGEWAKAGVMIANDITAAGSSAGDVAVFVTPGHGIRMAWDSDGDGFIDSSTRGAGTTYPCMLKIKREGTTFSGYYSTNGGENYTRIDSVDIGDAKTTQDAGIFAMGRDTLCTVEYNSTRVLDQGKVDTTDQQNATFSGSDGNYTIEAAGNLNSVSDGYGTIYEDEIINTDGEIVTTVESQENTGEWAKAGVMVTNDITAAGRSAGDVAVFVTPEHGIRMAWDSDGDGYMGTNTGGRSTTYPCTLKIERRGNSFSGYYSIDGGDTFSEIDTVEIGEAQSRQDAGIFAMGRDTLCTVEYSSMRVVDHATVDTTDQQTATFDGIGSRYTIEAAGNLNSSSDEYGAIYEGDTFESGSSVATTVENQEDTGDWAKTGVMVANDITAPGSSAGDVAVFVTPEHGIRMAWDSDGDGYMGSNTGGPSTTYPCRLKIEREGTTFNGYYSTDGGENYVLIDSVDIGDANTTQDAGIFAMGRDTLCTVEHTWFTTGPDPLPDGADPIDRLIFGNEASETAHNLSSETSVVAANRGRDTRRLEVPDTDDALSSISFQVDCDPDQRTYLTLKHDANPEYATRLNLYVGDEQLGLFGDYGHWGGLDGNLFIGGTQFGTLVNGTRADWSYHTYRLPEKLTSNQDSVEVRIAGNMSLRHGDSEHLYRLYTHTDPMVQIPSDEVRTPHRDIGVRTENLLTDPRKFPEDQVRSDPIAPAENEVERQVKEKQGTESRLHHREVVGLALAHSRGDWIDTVDQSAILKSIKEHIDYWVIEQAECSCSDPPIEGTSGNTLWTLHGWLARAFSKTSTAFEDAGLMNDPIPEHPNQDLTRREAYIDFWENGFDWRMQDRKQVLNQVASVGTNLIFTGRTLRQLNADGAPSDSKLDALIDETFGLKPRSDLDGDGAEGLEIAETFYHLTEAGLGKDFAYAMRYGKVVTYMLAAVADDTGLDRVNDRLIESLHARGQFRWYVRDPRPESNKRYTVQDGVLGSRGDAYPGDLNHLSGYGNVPFYAANLTGNEIAKRWAEHAAEEGMTSWLGNPGSRYRKLGLEYLINRVEGYRALQDMTDSTYTLPMEADTHVWADVDHQMVTITDGDIRLMMNFNHGSEGSAQSPGVGGMTQVHYKGPHMDRTVDLDMNRVEFEKAGSWDRPDATSFRWDWGRITRYLPWKDTTQEVHQYLAGQTIPRCAKPDGTEWENLGDPRGAYTTKFGVTDFGPYRVGINSSGDKSRGLGSGTTYKMAVPSGTVIDLETGKEVTADTVSVHKRDFRVLKIV